MLGSKLRKLRDEKGVSQQEVADFIKVTKQAYSLYELGKRAPDYETLYKLADYFGVMSAELLEDNPLTSTYLSFAKNAQDNGISPKDIQKAIEMIKQLREDKGD